MLELTLLGEITIRWQSEPITHFGRKKELALLTFLAHTGQTHSREALADLLWESSSTKQSLSNLRTIIARLRKQLGDQLVITRQTVAVTTAVHQQTDSVRFQSLLAAVDDGRSVNATRQLSEGLTLYGGELMAGFYLSDAPRFNDWLVVEQERLRQIALRGYQQLASWQEEQGAFTAGVKTAQQWVSWDPFDEIAQQQLMRHLTFAGQISEALTVYEKCQQLLHAELGIAPSPATVALHDAIQAGSLHPPTSSTAVRHNLPRVLTSLYGRQKELANLNKCLLNPTYPLIAITGVGGIGKTTLALAAGRQLVNTEQNLFKDGIWFVALEDVENEAKEKIRSRMAALAGQAIGLYFHGERDTWSQLLGQLAEKELLIILDNIEQFLPIASDLIVELLQAGEGIHLLVTSRTAVPLASSVAFPLAGIETPADASLEALQNDSVRLFAERAGRAKRPFHLEKHLAEVVAICQFVEGMPLGIELAAASLSRLMITEIVPALTNNLQLIETNQRNLPPRQRTLHAVFDYSWHLLTPEEQRILAQISIFRGGFTREAAEVVLQEGFSNIYNLLDHSLLTRNELGRFRMHPLPRQLAREKFNNPGMMELQAQTLNHHARYFADFMQSYEKALLLGVSQAELEAVLPEQANLQAAWQYAIETEQWEIIANCLDGMHHFYQRKGFFSEEAVLVDSTVNALDKTNLLKNESLNRLLSRLLTARAWLFLHSDIFDEGIKMAERACELAQGVEDTGCEGAAKLVWGRIHSRWGNASLALDMFEQVEALAKSARNQILEADGMLGIASHSDWDFNVIERQAPLLKTVELCQMLQYKRGEIQTLIWLGYTLGLQETPTKSLAYFEKALALSRDLGDISTEASVLGSLGRLYLRQGAFFGAQTYLEASLETFRKLNMPSQQEWVLLELGRAAIQLGDYDTADKRLHQAMMLAQQIGYMHAQADIKCQLGVMGTMQGETEKAVPLFTEAFEIVAQFEATQLHSVVLYYWGIALLNQGNWGQAEQKFQQAHVLRHGELPIGQAVLVGLAYAAYQQGKIDIAINHAEQLWQIWDAAPGWADQADLHTHWMLGKVWDGLEDGRASQVWQKSRALLQQRGDKIPDGPTRQMFYENVPAHRAILSLAA